MINFLNETLRQLFVTRMSDDLADPSQVSFDFPDDDFRNQVKTQGKNALNVCLVDLRENRTLASPAEAAGASSVSGGVLPQRRVDCHYLISAWSPATRSVEPAMDEHELLYKAMSILMDTEPLAPRRVYNGKAIPKHFPATFRNAEFPVVLLPVERFPKIAEFWSASKAAHWKPTLHLVVTLPAIPAR
jgi:Pvc16 N-terminal domain